MKMQISYDFTNLSQAIEIAKKTAQFADIIEIGTLLILAEGVNAIKEFKGTFPDKPLLTDVKLVDRVSEAIPLLIDAESSYVTVLYGTSNKVIKKATNLAHNLNAKIVLDLIDPDTMAQGASQAKSLDVDHVLFHFPHETDDTSSNIENWELIKGNTDLPIFISGRMNRECINEIVALKPQGIVVGHAITKAEDPEAEARYFKELITG